MNYPVPGFPAVSLALLVAFWPGALQAAPEKPWGRNSSGEVVVQPAEVAPSVRCAPWPAEWEEGFWQRARAVVEQVASPNGNYGNTYFENEKRSYGRAMLSIIAGHEEPGFKFLQREDNQAKSWNRHTLGIDYFPCFTLKHQMRKLFYFGPWLDAPYRKRMLEAAGIFTEKDPLRRPHPSYEGASGWGPNAKNSWVDVRSTDNLKLMRDTSVYLLAEAAGNDATRRLYLDRLRQFIVTMYRHGMGEWDSENYLGHSFVPLLNLYDFAKDERAQRLAKAGLDHMSAAAAVKYWRGNFNGPTKRDYNHPHPFGGSAAGIFWLYFGDAAGANPHPETDEIHVITSSYRPPPAVVHLARKHFEKPRELFAAKPVYHVWSEDKSKQPAYYETQFFGGTFQFGTLARGTCDRDVNGFKALVASGEKGAEQIVAAPMSKPTRLGSPQYGDGLAGPSCVAQYRNLAIYLTREASTPYLFLLPRGADVAAGEKVTFVELEETWIALYPIGLKPIAPDAGATEQARFDVRVDRKTGKEKRSPRWPDVQILSGKPARGGLYGFGIEFGEKRTHGSYEEFRDAVHKRSKLDTRKLDGPGGFVELVGSRGRRVGLKFGESHETLEIWRDGERRDLEQTGAVYQSADEKPAVIRQAWGGGVLEVEAGGASYRCEVSTSGEVEWESES